MANEQNLKSWKKGQSGNPKGKPKGVRNRSTVAKEVLSTVIEGRDPLTNEKVTLTIEEVMTFAQAAKAINDGDTASYRALMDSAYGTPSQSVDITTDGEKINQVTVFELPNDGRERT